MRHINNLLRFFKQNQRFFSTEALKEVLLKLKQTLLATYLYSKTQM